MSKEDILEAIKKMTVVEVAELVKALEDEFGISAAPVAAPVAAAPAQAEGSAEAAKEEQTEFKVTLQEIGDNKINVIKAVREVSALGLREAKELVEAAPTTVAEGISKEEADKMKAKIDESGAKAVVE